MPATPPLWVAIHGDSSIREGTCRHECRPTPGRGHAPLRALSAGANTFATSSVAVSLPQRHRPRRQVLRRPEIECFPLLELREQALLAQVQQVGAAGRIGNAVGAAVQLDGIDGMAVLQCVGQQRLLTVIDAVQGLEPLVDRSQFAGLARNQASSASMDFTMISSCASTKYVRSFASVSVHRNDRAYCTGALRIRLEIEMNSVSQ